MSITSKIRGLLKLPDITPEAVIVWVCLGLAGWAVLDEFARWLSQVG